MRDFDTTGYDLPDGFKFCIPSDHFYDTIGIWRECNQQRLPTFIVLTGPPGTGKTSDACGLMLSCKQQFEDRSTLFIDCNDIHTIDEEHMWRLKEAKMLMLDDYGARATEGAKIRVLTIVNKRMHHPTNVTIITTNLMHELKEHDPRMASRMNAACVINYAGRPDLRKGQT